MNWFGNELAPCRDGLIIVFMQIDRGELPPHRPGTLLHLGATNVHRTALEGFQAPLTSPATSGTQDRQVVIELDLHTHRPGRCDEVGLIRKNEARSPRTQALLVRGK